MNKKTLLVAALLIAAIVLLARWSFNSKSGNSAPDEIDFNWHVRPILSDRCFKCHGPDEKKRQADLRLDTEEGAFAALGPQKDHYAIVPGKPAESTLIARIYSTDPDSMMPTPESHLTLTDPERDILRRWIEQGAKWKKHWAFEAPVRPELPSVSDKKWCRNPIDYFAMDRLDREGLTPAPEADKERLLRRVSFDLTGLPPSPQLLAQFLNDNGADAYDRCVDTLLASQAYGERWAIFWLDLARYSDTHGYQDDLPRVMWPWRDWVIHAFNQNMPYDRFVTLQLAGDQLPDANKETMLASAFNRNHKISQEGGVIEEEYRVEYVADRTNTFGKAFLGLTMECARCHDHKYDPIPTRAYYGTSAFFNKLSERGFVPNLETPMPYMPIVQADLKESLRFLHAGSVLKSEKDTIFQMIMQDSLENGGRKAYILTRGQYDQHGAEVTEMTPEAVLPYDTMRLPRNRLGLAKWLFDPAHPLTARVSANQIWQEIFGRGIVATTENFGVQGALPSHPALLDWLAVEYRESGWNMKHLMHLMVTSATYRQSSVCPPALRERDPENMLLARGPRYRMQYEFIRDNILASSGLLIAEVGGPSVKPWQPPGIWEEITVEKSATNYRGEFGYGGDTSLQKIYRRSVYTYNRRTIPPPASLVFDAPLRDDCQVRRTRTSTPLQALNLLNDQQILEASRVLSQKILNDPKYSNAQTQIQESFWRILGRKPQSAEMRLLEEFYAGELSRYQNKEKQAQQILRVGQYPQIGTQAPAIQAAMMLTICTIYNLDEAMSKT